MYDLSRLEEACSIKLTPVMRRRLLQKYNFSQIRAKKKKISFTLSIDEFFYLVTKECYYCGASPTFHKTGIMGIDRRKNEAGYEFNNCFSCCKMCNYAKFTYEFELFLIWINKVYINLSKKGFLK